MVRAIAVGRLGMLGIHVVSTLAVSCMLSVYWCHEFLDGYTPDVRDFPDPLSLFLHIYVGEAGAQD